MSWRSLSGAGSRIESKFYVPTSLPRVLISSISRSRLASSRTHDFCTASSLPRMSFLLSSAKRCGSGGGVWPDRDGKTALMSPSALADLVAVVILRRPTEYNTCFIVTFGIGSELQQECG